MRTHQDHGSQLVYLKKREKEEREKVYNLCTSARMDKVEIKIFVLHFWDRDLKVVSVTKLFLFSNVSLESVSSCFSEYNSYHCSFTIS